MRAILLLLMALPVLAEAPEDVIIKPVANCADGWCVMAEKDFRTLQNFHAVTFFRMGQINEAVNEIRAENQELRRKLQRFAAGCEGNGT